MVPGMGPISGGSGGVELGGGTSSAEASGGSDGGGAVFNFTPPPGSQNVQNITQTVGLVAVAGLVLWLMSRK